MLRDSNVRIRCYDSNKGYITFVAEYISGAKINTVASPPPTADECMKLVPVGWMLYEEGGSYRARPWQNSG